jgi:hypothetical protein
MRFTSGLNQKADPRSLEAPELARLVDAQFDEVGGIQTRYPYEAAVATTSTATTLTDCRRVAASGAERLMFTGDSLYSQNAQDDKWHLRSEHLAVAVDQTPVFQTTEEQVTCDRAELDGVIVYAWTVSLTGGNKTYVAARDKTTGAIVLSPTALAGNAVSPRLVALSTKILLTFADGLGALLAYAIDPASPGTALAGASTSVIAAAFNADYDVVRMGATDGAVFAARLTPTTSYTVGTISSALVVVSSTKARASAGPIALDWNATISRLLVVRNSAAGSIVGDILDAALADVSVSTAIGSTAFPVRNVTCAWEQGASTTAWAFWDDNGATFSSVFRNTITSAAAVGTQADVNLCTLATRAFAYDGDVYTWYATDEASSSVDTAGVTLFSAALENVYILYRDDAKPFAKAAYTRAGGRPGAGNLPGVDPVDATTYAWCGTECRVISTDAHSFPAYADRNPLDIVVEFDTNRARRTASSGGTTYIPCALGLMQYDGVGLAEVGFLQFPSAFTLADGGAGTMAAGGYSYKCTYRWQNAVGEVDRSTTATFKGITQIATKEVDITFNHLDHTLKRDPRGDVAIEFWRTVADAPPGAPFYLVTGIDPSATTGDNCYIKNTYGTAGATFTDSYTDATLTSKGSDPETGDTLESLAPPPCTLIAATDSRIFLAGVAGDPDRVWYSKQRNIGEVAAFNDGLTVAIPPAGGAITALALLNRTLFVFREKAVYRVDGEGIDNVGGGFNYQVEELPGNVGAVSQEAVAVTDKGIIFKSLKGWYLTNGQSSQYIGGQVSDYDDDDVTAATVVEKQHQVRIVTDSRMLVFDTLVGQWAEWSVNDALHACMWGGAHVYVTEDGPRAQQTDYTGVDYGIDVETAWIKLNDLQGYGAVDCFDLLGEYQSACTVQVRLARDYVPTFFQDKTHTPSSTAGLPLELRHRPSIRQVKALKVRITIAPTTAGESVKLTGIAFKLGAQPGLNRNVAQGAKQ